MTLLIIYSWRWESLVKVQSNNLKHENKIYTKLFLEIFSNEFWNSKGAYLFLRATGGNHSGFNMGAFTVDSKKMLHSVPGLEKMVFDFSLLICYPAALILSIILFSTSEISLCLEITYGSCQNPVSGSLGLRWDSQVWISYKWRWSCWFEDHMLTSKICSALESLY